MRLTTPLKMLLPIGIVIIFGLGGMPVANAKSEGMAVTVASVPKSDVKQVQARVLIDAPPNLVWQVLTNYPDWKNMVPGYERSTVLKSTDSGKVLDVGMKVSALLPACRYQVQVTENPSIYQVQFNRIAGDFDSLRATYRLIPQNNNTRTLLAYQLNIDMGVNLPGVHGILKSNTEKSLKALEHRSELEARKSMIGQR